MCRPMEHRRIYAHVHVLVTQSTIQIQQGSGTRLNEDLANVHIWVRFWRLCLRDCSQCAYIAPNTVSRCLLPLSNSFTTIASSTYVVIIVSLDHHLPNEESPRDPHAVATDVLPAPAMAPTKPARVPKEDPLRVQS